MREVDGTIWVDAEKLVKAIGTRLSTESAFLSPEPATVIVDPRGVLSVVEAAGAKPETIDRWLRECKESQV